MNSLTYQAKHHYRILKTVYETEDDASIFYKAFDEVEKRHVGIKSLKVHQKDLNRVKAEAMTLHRFATKSTSIPALYHTHYDANQERYYLIMQFIESGRTLEQMLKGRITYKQAIQILIDLCDALTPLHKEKFQHRDLKPANIMIDHNH